jgi:Vitamin K-dependent gamma-carboxylase
MNRRRAIGAWGRFWFTPQPTSAVALFRIALGLVTFLWGLALLPNVTTFFTTDGIEPVPVDVTWGLLGHFTSDTAVYLTYTALLLSALCVTVGFRTRLASIVMFITLFALIQRTHSIFNSGDGLLRILAFFLMFMPAGESLSLDRWRTAPDAFWEFPARSPWALRLVQIQVSVLYLAAVYSKVEGGGWTDGSALSYVWRMDDIVRFHVPGFIAGSVTLSTLAAFLTLAVEFMIGVFVWVPSARPLVLGLGVVMHIGIDLTLRIGFFSSAILVAYLAFLSPDAAGSLAIRARDLVTARRRARAQAPGSSARSRTRTTSAFALFARFAATKPSASRQPSDP